MDSYYDALKDSYDSLYGEEQLLKIEKVLGFIDCSRNKRLLDVGAGTGFYLDMFKCDVYALEPSSMINSYSGNAHIVRAFAEQIPFADGFFDIVVSFTAIQNFKDPAKAFDEMLRVGKNLFVLSFLKRGSNANMLRSLLIRKFSSKSFSIQEIPDSKDFIFILKK